MGTRDGARLGAPTQPVWRREGLVRGLCRPRGHRCSASFRTGEEGQGPKPALRGAPIHLGGLWAVHVLGLLAQEAAQGQVTGALSINISFWSYPQKSLQDAIPAGSPLGTFLLTKRLHLGAGGKEPACKHRRHKR